ncbi:probable LRR receptor-like serine/threonine-protein kinase At1g51880 [Humulus lupulus]|uniref:probable LRR receptor-like serine/threonine-protein kinase At1g51880 n=1 Tax=Humulus lupulus TaxID=3486 RepID=UPI002B406695|nr:probable LRR receptor-like serine/threonine-protein kinase At1g51880 [Humulus lupulus]
MVFSKLFLVAILQLVALSLLGQAQDRKGFISIDCGTSDSSSYTDEKTNIVYSSDAEFIETGENKVISPDYKVLSHDQQLWNLRFFPEGIRNCYTLKPSLSKGNKYLIRARFLYGNYDDKNQIPKFDLHLGVDLWTTVIIQDTSSTLDKEIIHSLSSDRIHVCLVNIGGGTPFISALELRPIENDVNYITETGSSLLLYGRYAFSLPANQVVKKRFNDDAYDRLWEQLGWVPFIKGPSSTNENSISKNRFGVPFSVMNTAYVPNTNNNPRSLEITWKSFDRVNSYKLYFHFTELEELQTNQSREFSISINGALWDSSIIPKYLSEFTVYSKEGERFDSGKMEISLNSSENSTSPPLINALEVYMVKELSGRETNKNDVDAISNVKSVYQLNKLKWQGDPCAPEDYQWDGLNCSTNNSPRIISLNLSSSGLNGEIATSIADLTVLQSLDLSNNNLSGAVPTFLAQLLFLRVLNLSGNNFTGPIPDALLIRRKNGLLLSIDTNNSSSSSSPPCSSKSCGKKKNLVVPLVASLSGLLFVCFTIVIIIWRLRRRHHHAAAISLEGRNLNSVANEEDESYNNKMQQYTYSEIQKVTNNFQRVLGEGGFGKVYHGYLNGTEVAVKMLSSSSTQGHRQFHAELKLLLRVHHKNLTTLVGFCNEGSEVGLIYEYMAMGNLRSLLSGSSSDIILSWEQRLQIAIDTAQGLEYLHNGCKPPIVHRDVKSTNILLNEKFRAKLGDFGLSRVFGLEGNNHTSTFAAATTRAGITASVAGTPGYLDPEYYISNWLNEKSDVYSFGIVLLEIITARPVVATTQQNNHIIQWVSSMIAKGNIKSILDPRLEVDVVDINTVWKVIEISMACVSKTSTSRPTMSRVALDLNECLTTSITRNNSHLDETHEHSTTDLDEIISKNMASEFSPVAR